MKNKFFSNGLDLDLVRECPGFFKVSCAGPVLSLKWKAVKGAQCEVIERGRGMFSLGAREYCGGKRAGEGDYFEYLLGYMLTCSFNRPVSIIGLLLHFDVPTLDLPNAHRRVRFLLLSPPTILPKCYCYHITTEPRPLA